MVRLADHYGAEKVEVAYGMFLLLPSPIRVPFPFPSSVPCTSFANILSLTANLHNRSYKHAPAYLRSDHQPKRPRGGAVFRLDVHVQVYVCLFGCSMLDHDGMNER